MNAVVVLGMVTSVFVGDSRIDMWVLTKVERKRVNKSIKEVL